MCGPEKLLESQLAWHTTMGGWFPGQGRVVFRGKDLLQDLKDLPWMALFLYSITGKAPTTKQVTLFEGIWTICTSYPDPRLWNNRVSALAGTTRSTASLAMGAANAVSEASIYGRRPDIRAIDFLYRTQASLDEGCALVTLIQDELNRHRTIPGYGRPITRQDERIKPILELAEKLELATGKYVRLCFEIEKTLKQERLRFQMNIAALAAALAADQGLSRREYYHYLTMCFSVGILACYIDSSLKPEGTLFPLDCSYISYEGHPHRQWD